MKQRIFVLALALGLACTSGVLYGAAPEDFTLLFAPPASDVDQAGGSVDLEVILKTQINGTQGWSVGAALETDPGVTAQITDLKMGQIMLTINKGNKADFEALNFYGADLASPPPGYEPIPGENPEDPDISQNTCNMENTGDPANGDEGGCTGIVGAAGLTQGITIHIMTVNTLPASPDGIVVMNLTVEAQGEGEGEGEPQARLNFSDTVGDPPIATVAVFAGLSYTPATQEGAVINLIPDPCLSKISPYTMSISDNSGANGDNVDSVVTLNFSGDGTMDDADIQAWSYGICVDEMKLNPVAATIDDTMTATALDGGPPEFNVTALFAGGVTHAVALSVNPPLATIPAQNNWTDLVVTYEITMTVDGDVATISPCGETLGEPPVRNVMSVEGQSTEMSSLMAPDPCCERPDVPCNEAGAIVFSPFFKVIPGSANGDGLLDIADAVYLLNWLFRDGDPLPCELAADANADCAVDSSDAVFILEYIFLEGLEPPRGEGCQMLTPDTCPGLSCETSSETNC